MTFEPDFEYDRYGGHEIDFDVILRELFRVITLIYSASTIWDMDQAAPPVITEPFPDLSSRTSIGKLQRKFLSGELSRGLIYVAVSMRILDDRAPNLFDKNMEAECGSFAEQNKSVRPLCLRKACNKIIHASEFIRGPETVFYDQNQEEVRRWNDLTGANANLDNFIFLRGDMSNKAWTCAIRVDDFSDLVVKAVNFHKAQEAANE